MFVKPWSKESEMIFRQLSLNGRAYTTDTRCLPKQFGVRCKNIIDNDLLDVATIRNKRQRRTWFVTPPDIMVVPKPGQHGVFFHFKRFKIL